MRAWKSGQSKVLETNESMVITKLVGFASLIGDRKRLIFSFVFFVTEQSIHCVVKWNFMATLRIIYSPSYININRSDFSIR